MLARFYRFNKKKNSTKIPGANVPSITKDITLKDNVSYDNPTIIVKDIDFTYNYAYLFDSYYFIEDIRYMNSELVQLNLVKDNLGTYKDEILEYTAFVERSASDYNIFINDSELSSEQRIVHSAKRSRLYQ